MTILKAVLAELYGMFLGDLRLSVALLALVGLVAALLRFTAIAPLLAGGLLLAGALLVLLAVVLLEAHRRTNS